jgi:hypothetical protein
MADVRLKRNGDIQIAGAKRHRARTNERVGRVSRRAPGLISYAANKGRIASSVEREIANGFERGGIQTASPHR